MAALVSAFLITRWAATPAVASLEITVAPAATAGEKVAILVEARDANGNPLPGANISLVAIAREGRYMGDHRRALPLEDLENGSYTAELSSQWAGTWTIMASSADDPIVRARAETTFEPGPPKEIIACISDPYNFEVLLYMSDPYGNATSFAPQIESSLARVESLETQANGSWRAVLSPIAWGAENLLITDAITGISEELEVSFAPLYAKLSYPGADVIAIEKAHENGDIVLEWSERENLVTVTLVVRWLKGEFGRHELTLEFDNTNMKLVDVRGGDPERGLGEPTVVVVEENELQLTLTFNTGESGAADYEILELDFELAEPIFTVNILRFDEQKAPENSLEVVITDLALYERTTEPVYDEKGHVVGYETVLVPVDIPTPFIPHIVHLKPLRRLIVPMKFWLVENCGYDRKWVWEAAEKAENNFRRAALQCKLDWWVVIIPEVNYIPRENWKNTVGADNELTGLEDNDLFNAFHWNPEAWLNVYVVPPSGLEDDAIGWWWDKYGDGRSAIFTDESKDLHDRNLTHELMHEFSKSRVKDSPADNAAAQGGRDPNNVMRYCGGGKEISEKQGEILNEEIGKRAERYDADGDGKPEGYIYRP